MGSHGRTGLSPWVRGEPDTGGQSSSPSLPCSPAARSRSLIHTRESDSLLTLSRGRGPPSAISLVLILSCSGNERSRTGEDGPAPSSDEFQPPLPEAERRTGWRWVAGGRGSSKGNARIDAEFMDGVCSSKRL